MNTLALLVLLAVPFVVIGALIAWLTVTIGRETRGGK
jgi:hypothetical protein